MPKTPKTPAAEAFSFDHDGTTYTFRPTLEVLTPGFIRRNRHNDADAAFTLLESLADEEALEVIDNMTFKENAALMVEFQKHIEAVMGEALGN